MTEVVTTIWCNLLHSSARLFLFDENARTQSRLWSGVRDSNPFRWLGKPGHNPYTNPANGLSVTPSRNRPQFVTAYPHPLGWCHSRKKITLNAVSRPKRLRTRICA